jgi:hypothetical protein
LQNEPDELAMSTNPDREYMDARLEAVEARSNSRVESIEIWYARFSAEQDARFSQQAAADRERFARQDEQLARMDERFKRGDERMSRMEQTMAQIQIDIKNLRTTIIITAISATLGVAALNAALVSSIFAALDSGKVIAEAQAEIKKSAVELGELLKKNQEDAEKKPAPPAK